jgi:hypothetical protein
MERMGAGKQSIVAGLGVIVAVEGKRSPLLARGLDKSRVVVVAETPLPVGATLPVELLYRAQRVSVNGKVEAVHGDEAEIVFAADAGQVAALEQLASLVAGQAAGPAPSGAFAATLAWAHLPDGRSWNWWRKVRHTGHVTALADELATISCKARPDVGETVLIFIGGPGAAESALSTCRAECVAHAEGTFDVKFLSPRTDFKRTIARLLGLAEPS